MGRFFAAILSMAGIACLVAAVVVFYGAEGNRMSARFRGDFPDPVVKASEDPAYGKPSSPQPVAPSIPDEWIVERLPENDVPDVSATPPSVDAPAEEPVPVAEVPEPVENEETPRESEAAPFVPVASDPPVEGPAQGAAGEVALVISEIMYHPGDASAKEKPSGPKLPEELQGGRIIRTDDGLVVIKNGRVTHLNGDGYSNARHTRPEPENLALEFVELHNNGGSAIDLKGFRFSSGISYVFPEYSLEPGAYLVVAANVRVFKQRYPNVKNVVGGWEGRLGNSGETIRLKDASGNTVDRVSYSDQGMWAVRGRAEMDNGQNNPYYNGRWGNSAGYRGWTWKQKADGDGSSLELIDKSLSNKAGHNWASSREAGGTPGRANSVAAEGLAPLIRSVSHSPAVPTSTEPVTVSVKLSGTKENSRVVLRWRIASRSRSDKKFNETDMRADGPEGLWTATIPPQKNRSVVEFQIRTSSGETRRVWPLTEGDKESANALFQIDDRQSKTRFAQYRLVITPRELDDFGDINRYSDAQMNATLIVWDGGEPVIRYGCGLRYRGAGSRTHTPPPLRVNIPRDNPWNDWTKLNLNSRYSWLQYAGMQMFRASRLRAPDCRPVVVSINGEVQARGMNSDYDYGCYVHVQPVGSGYVSQYFPEDPSGNAYKKGRPDRDWRYNGDNYNYERDGWNKLTHGSVDDWSDLTDFLKTMSASDRSRDYLENIEKRVDLDQWLDWFAAMHLLVNGEGGLSNGVDDDFAMYRGVKDPRFRLIPHDLDTILGRGDDSQISNYRHTFFDMTGNGNSLRPLKPLFRRDDIRKRYFQSIRRLARTGFSDASFRLLADNHLRGWVPSREIDRLKKFASYRTRYALQKCESELGRTPSMPVPTSHPAVRSDHGDLFINEVMASPDKDMIELYNSSAAEMDLSGMFLTDNPSEPNRFVIPEGVKIAAKGYCVFGDGESAHDCTLKLNADGEGVWLFARPADGGDVVDHITFGPQIEGHSIGRTGKNQDAWQLNHPTPGAANKGAVTVDPRALCINEWLCRPHVKAEEDFVELVNKTDKPVALSGLSLTDDAVNYPRRFVFPHLSFIAGKGYHVVEAVGGKSARPGRDLPFKLASHYGWISLIGVNDVMVDQVHYHTQHQDMSQGRLPDGNDRFGRFTQPTPGRSNGEKAGTSASFSNLRVTELMFNPPEGGPNIEFLEITNAADKPMSLMGLEIRDGIQFVFPEESLEAGESAVIVANQDDFHSHFGDTVRILGVYSSKLSNSGETLEIVEGETGKTLRFAYDDNWYPDADGGGRSLELRHSGISASAWSNAESWKPSVENGGTPGKCETRPN